MKPLKLRSHFRVWVNQTEFLLIVICLFSCCIWETFQKYGKTFKWVLGVSVSFLIKFSCSFFSGFFVCESSFSLILVVGNWDRQYNCMESQRPGSERYICILLWSRQFSKLNLILKSVFWHFLPQTTKPSQR